MQFFYGSENAELGQKLYQFGLNEDRKKICRQQSKCKCFLQQNKMSIYIKTGNIFFNNVNSVESIYDFLVAQQSYNIKKMEFGFTFSADYKSYVSEYHKKHKHSHKSTNKR